MRHLKSRSTIAGGAAAILAVLGIGGAVTTAQASTPDQGQSQSAQQTSDGDGEANDTTEAKGAEGAEETNDGPDKGPDANPNEPGHQDADESGESN